MYKNIIFDLYGTLIDIWTNESKDEFWNQMSLFFSYNGAFYTADELKSDYLDIIKKRLGSNKKSKYPDTKVVLALKTLYKNKGVNPDAELLDHTIKLFRIASTERIKLYPNVKEMLETLKKHDKRLYILSNGQKEFSVPEIKYLGIYDYLDGIYSSAEIGICKPDKAFFDYVLKKEKLLNSESLFVGNDSTSDIAGANAASLDSVYIHSNLSGNDSKTTATYEIWDGNVLNILKYAI